LIINRGRLLYDGALRELVLRTNPGKRIELVLGNGVERRDLEVYGTVCRYQPPNAALVVPRERAADISARLLAALPVVDLSIQDPPIEEVIREVFAEQAEKDTAAIGVGSEKNEGAATDHAAGIEAGGGGDKVPVGDRPGRSD
jgi:ABC-2 type transport system ATP-binding protein